MENKHINTMKKFLFKFPSRGRPETFKSTLTAHINHLSNKHEYLFIFTFDNDDTSMNNDDIKTFIQDLKINHKIYYGDSKNKIEAINANLENETYFDILILIADDMIPVMKDYDELISNIFDSSKLELDCVIHFNTARWANLLDIWCVMGQTYYKRFNYIYNPEYCSICCDNEYTEVSILLNKQIFSELSPFNHNNVVSDETEARNWWFNTEDSLTYERRKLINYNLDKINN
jgi:hypothetical protein